ncbi:MAG: flagellar assembly protein FliW [Planctomycetota bacterium]
MPAAHQENAVARVIVQTVHKGAVEVEESAIIRFVSPLLGFNHLERFIVYQTHEGPLYWLQAVDDPQACFCLLAPFEAGLDPDIEIGAEDAAALEAREAGDIVVYTMVVLDEDPDQIRTNLRAPILVGRQSSLAKQIVVGTGKLPVQFYLNRLGQKGG